MKRSILARPALLARLPLAAALLIATAARADEARPLLLALDKGEISYTVVHKLHQVTGITRKVEGLVRLQPGAPTLVQVRAPVATFDSGNSNRDAHMREATHEPLHPVAEVKGTLPPITLPLAGPQDVTMDARVELNGRSPWGQFQAAKRDVDAAILEQIAHRRARQTEQRGDDVLSLLLEARDENGAPMSDEELRDELLTLLVAGHETTATSLAWAFDLLLHNRTSLDALVADIDAGNDTWVDATVKETLRIRPVVPIVVRLLQRPFTVMGRDLPAGAVVAPCIYLTHRRADVYPRPERFMPERFVNGAADPYA